MAEPKMNFDNLPTSTSGQGNIEVGPNHLKIKSAKRELSKKGKIMLVLVVTPVSQEKITIWDRFTLFDKDYNPESFGQYKLRKLLEAVNYKPQKDFSIEVLTKVLPGLEFMADLEIEEVGSKEYFQIGDVESYKPVTEEKEVTTNPKPEDFMEDADTSDDNDEEVDSEIINKLEEDGDIV